VQRRNVDFAVQSIHPRDVCSRHEMTVNVDRDLNGAVAHLILHVSQAGAILNERRTVGVPSVVKSEHPKTCMLQGWVHITYGDVIGLQRGASLRRKDKFIGDRRLAFQERTEWAPPINRSVLRENFSTVSPVSSLTTRVCRASSARKLLIASRRESRTSMSSSVAHVDAIGVTQWAVIN
jgi:hypothetical protein